MDNQNSESLRYRLPQDTQITIKDDIVANFDRFDSVADFSRKAIRGNAGDIVEISKGGKVANKIVRRISEIRGIEEAPAQCLIPSTSIEDNFDRSLSTTISRQSDGLLNDIQDETELKHSQAAQYCIFKELRQFAEVSDVMDSGAERKAIEQWAKLEGSILNPQLNLKVVLAKRFIEQESTTRYFISNDKDRFQEFAEVYRDDFYGTEMYERLNNLFGSTVTDRVEEVIEDEISFLYFTKKDIK